MFVIDVVRVFLIFVNILVGIFVVVFGDNKKFVFLFFGVNFVSLGGNIEFSLFVKIWFWIVLKIVILRVILSDWKNEFVDVVELWFCIFNLWIEDMFNIENEKLILSLVRIINSVMSKWGVFIVKVFNK